jgi:methylated-DNA-[protein]-cysteine S-methyltransferase
MPHHARLRSPLGELLLVGEGETLTGLFFPGHRPAPALDPGRHDPGALRDAVSQLEQYFAGERTRFTLALAPRGTPFQRAVWARMQEIPHGRTLSYGRLAQELRPGRESTGAGIAHPRAVGSASARNPISIVIPCHRMLGARGELAGYAGGLERKRALLTHEGVRLPSAGAPGARPMVEVARGPD